RKEQQMKRITRITVLTFGLMALTGLAEVVPGLSPLATLQPTTQAATHHVFTLDLAVDCRTAVTEFNRGATFIINGKLFPAGTLPTGPPPTPPAHPATGAAPIGFWLVRGHPALPSRFLPAAIPQRYSSAPADFGTTYFILDGGRSALNYGNLCFPAGPIHSPA